MLVVVEPVAGVVVEEEVAPLEPDDAATAAGAELELSPRATNNAAPTTPIATAVPTDIPPAADPLVALDCAFTEATGLIARSNEAIIAIYLFFITTPFNF